MKGKRKLFQSIFVLLLVLLGISGMSKWGVTEVKAAESTRKYVIVLDPGHSAGEPGAGSAIDGVTYQEEVINWKLAQYLKEELQKIPTIDVYLTRETFKTNKSLYDRVKTAQQYHADLLVSLHIDSSESSAPNGASILISNGNYRPLLAKRERLLASLVSTELQGIGLNWRGEVLRNSENGSLYPNGKARDYYGIVASSIEMNLPGVIIEHCFITNPSDAKNHLRTNAQIKKMALADAKAIVKYCEQVDIVAPKEGWIEEADGIYYYKKGKVLKSQFITDTTGKYYVDRTGKMVKGWKVLNKKTYYFDTKTGKQVFGWKTIKNNKYYFASSTGVMFQNLLNANPNTGVIRYFHSDGKLAVNEFITYNEKTYYMNAKGEAVKGFKTIGGKTYYFVSQGSYMCKSKKLINSIGNIYYVNAKGVRAENKFVTLKEGTKKRTYYFGSDGVAYKGWHTINGKKYYFSKDGIMAKNRSLTNSAGLVSVFDENGVLVKQYYES